MASLSMKSVYCRKIGDGDTAVWRLEADRTVVCGSTALLSYIHAIGALVFVGIVVVFPTIVCRQVRRIKRQGKWEDPHEMVKFSNFYGDFKTVRWASRYFFFAQHFFEDTLLAVIEVYFDADTRLVTILTAACCILYIAIVCIVRPFAETEIMAIDMTKVSIEIFCLLSYNLFLPPPPPAGTAVGEAEDVPVGATILVYSSVVLMGLFVLHELEPLLQLARLCVNRMLCSKFMSARSGSGESGAPFDVQPVRIGHGGRIGIHERTRRKRHLWGTVVLAQNVVRFLHRMKLARLYTIEVEYPSSVRAATEREKLERSGSAWCAPVGFKEHVRECVHASTKAALDESLRSAKKAFANTDGVRCGLELGEEADLLKRQSGVTEQQARLAEFDPITDPSVQLREGLEVWHSQRGFGHVEMIIAHEKKPFRLRF